VAVERPRLLSGVWTEEPTMKADEISPGNPRPVTVLLISADEKDHLFVRRALGHSNWTLYRCYNLAEAVQWLRNPSISVVITDDRLEGNDWHDVFRLTENLPWMPQVIVTTGKPETELWAEVLNAGAYDVLVKPWDERELFHVVSHAWLAWKRDTDTLQDR
jgi:DNA-binding NtrC family response regulator